MGAEQGLLETNIKNLKLKNPVITASGTYGYGEEYSPFVDLTELGAITLKGITLAPQEGNIPPRIAETPAGMLNSIGLENPGVDRLLTEILPRIRKLNVPLIVNIAGKTVEEYAEIAVKLDKAQGISAVEVNISCPNVNQGCLTFGSDPTATGEVVRSVAANTSLPVIAKLSPNVGDIVRIAECAADAGAAALSLINTLRGMSIDVARRRPALGNVIGGLSGPAVKPVAVYMTWEVSRAIKGIPVIGMGGITCAEDALEFILAGATAVSVGTANFVDPRVPLWIIEGLRNYCTDWGIDNIGELVGAAWKEGKT